MNDSLNRVDEAPVIDPNDIPVADRVVAGALLLDDALGDGWRDNIDLSTLNLVEDEDCVLGQLYGSYAEGCHTLGITSGVQAARNGFAVVSSTVGWLVMPYTDTDRERYEELTEAWRRYLNAAA